MAVADIYRIEIFYNIGSELTENVVHLKETETCTDDVPAETVGRLIYDLWAAFVSTPLFSEETLLTLIKVRRIKPTTGIPAVVVVGSTDFPPVAGEGVAEPLPSTSAMLISMYTNVLDGSGRGRIYIPGLAQGTQNDGQLSQAAIDLGNSFADELEEERTPGGAMTGKWRFCVYSRGAETGENVKQAFANSNLATQRRRRNHPGIGN